MPHIVTCARGPNLFECSPQPAVRRVMVLSGLYTLTKTIGLAVSQSLCALLPSGLLTAAVCLCGSVESCR
ncbi:hypothetical protein FZN19_06110 [Escherichia coli]|nr:hypothetical protein [Escherichia coli]